MTGFVDATAGLGAHRPRRKSPESARPGRQRDSFRTLFAVLPPPNDTRDWVVLTDAALPVDSLTSWATTARAGAVVCFVGMVRDHAEGRDGVRGMTYEAYEEPARRVMHEIAAEARRRWPDLERIALLHRVGDLGVSAASVAVAVSSPHRDEAFAAARFCIDTVKESAPIWKQEHWAGGSDWAHHDASIKPVAGARRRQPREASTAPRNGA
jgi:molybdopterin synthase catalytic subunit